MAVFESSITLKCSAEKAFDFLARPENISRLTPPDSALQFVDAPEVLSAGLSIRAKASVYGMTYDLAHDIQEFDKPSRITEVQTKGPLPKWTRETSIANNGDETITITEHIEFSPPGGLAGFVMTEAKIRASLIDSYAYRDQKLRELLEST
ncbi:MAG: hypothetical protein CMJ78_09855 [Planctomycetaceae bacterium]|nr:hypothetical protein [Planctomycetaceae bacterium]